MAGQSFKLTSTEHQSQIWIANLGGTSSLPDNLFLIEIVTIKCYTEESKKKFIKDISVLIKWTLLAKVKIFT